jgi:hypothetical protein
LLAVLNGANGNKTLVVETLARLKNLPPEKQASVKAMVSKMLDSAKGTAEFVQLVEQFDLKDRNDELLAYAAANPTDVAAGTAIKQVIKHDPKTLDKALAGKDSAKLAAALGASTDRTVIALLGSIVGDAKRELAVRQAAVAAMTKSKQGSKAILDLAAKKQLAPELTAAAASQLHNSSHRDIRDEAAKLLPVPTAKGSEKLPPVEKLITMKGNAVHGKEVFVSATCVTCHIVNGQGTMFGSGIVGDRHQAVEGSPVPVDPLPERGDLVRVRGVGGVDQGWG